MTSRQLYLMMKSRPQREPLPIKRLLTDVEESGESRLTVRLKAICDGEISVYGAPGSSLRRRIQRKFGKIKKKSLTSYFNCLIENGVKPGPVTLLEQKNSMNMFSKAGGEEYSDSESDEDIDDYTYKDDEYTYKDGDSDSDEYNSEDGDDDKDKLAISLRRVSLSATTMTATRMATATMSTQPRFVTASTPAPFTLPHPPNVGILKPSRLFPSPYSLPTIGTPSAPARSASTFVILLTSPNGSEENPYVL
jgi:transcription elongation factor Elf1